VLFWIFVVDLDWVGFQIYKFSTAKGLTFYGKSSYNHSVTITFCFSIFGAGIAVISIPYELDIYLIGISAAVYGVCLGSWYVLMPVLLADIFGTERIGSSYGFVRLFQSLGAISVPPLAGLLRDVSGDYKSCFYCMGSSMVFGCVPMLIWIFFYDKNEEDDAEGSSTDSS